jgi:calcineurin-like phosphoesterase family protein
MIKISDNTFIISDLHLTHKNIIKYCNRQYDLSPDGVAKMKEDLLSEFDKLPTTCTVWNLGDLFDTKPHSLAEAKEVVKRMKGPKGLRKLYLVLGNHDVCRLSSSRIKFYYEAGFDKVYDSPIIVNDKFILSHEPVYIAPGSNFINIYGHTHDEDICKPDNINNEGLSNYFMYDWDNWAMISKVYRKEGKEPPDKEQFLKYPERGVSPVNYYNVCWDMHNKILSFNDIITNCK